MYSNDVASVVCVTASYYKIRQETVNVYYKSKGRDSYSHPNTTSLMAWNMLSTLMGSDIYFNRLTSPPLSLTLLFSLPNPPFAPQMFFPTIWQWHITQARHECPFCVVRFYISTGTSNYFCAVWTNNRINCTLYIYGKRNYSDQCHSFAFTFASCRMAPFTVFYWDINYTTGLLLQMH